MKCKILAFILICSLSGVGQNQVRLDSLLIKLNNSTEDTARVRILLEIANQYSHNNYIKAVDYSRQALAIATKTGSSRLIAQSHLNLGNNLLFEGNYDEALNNYLESLKIVPELKDDEITFQNYHNLGVLKDRLSQFEEALDYYFKALAILEKNISSKKFSRFQRSYPVIYNNIGNIYETKKDYKASEEYYLKGYNMIKDSVDEIFGVITNNLGKLEIEMGNFDKALEYLNESLEFRKRINDKHGIAKTYLFFAIYYKEKNDYDMAIDFANKALEISEQTNTLLTSQNAILILSEVYELDHNYQKALHYYKQFKTLSDSLINYKKYSEIARLQLQYENEIANREKLVKEQRMRIRMIMVTSLLLLGIILISLLFFLSRSRNKRIKLEKEKLEQDMQVKNKELATNVMYMLKKNELIDSITQRLLSLKGKLKEENRELIQKIIFDLQSITDKEVWEEFELRFQDVHEDFYKNLKSKFPDLTPAEIKLAAFLRLNMTSKDIASITGQSVNSLETARYRLRKKLGITNQEVNLVKFLLDF